MNDLDELKRFVVAHAISQNLPADHYAAVLDRITTDTVDEPGSWPHEWIRAGLEREAAGEHLGAAQYYNLGRFPFVDGPGRKRALDLCLASFEVWRSAADGVEVETVQVDGVPVRILTAGLSADAPRPLLIMTGGIVSPKEQWGAVLPQLAATGLAGVVADLPGVGESPLRYHRESWRLFPAILDALTGRAKVEETYLLALSFSGHTAIEAALRDSRIRGIVGNGPPIREFFRDAVWQKDVPKVTTDTLASLVGTSPADVYHQVRDWALTEEWLRSLDIPLAVVTARRDEIIPPADAALLRSTVARLEIVEHDDVHGAPSHLAETRAWSLLAVQRMRPDAPAAVIEALASAAASAAAREAR
jgi:esterase FrsA